MPPKAALTIEEFLAKCFKHMNEKPNINFDTLAQETGMSKGGASNKFRAFMKQFEDDGVDGNTADPPATPANESNKKKSNGAKRGKEAETSEEHSAVEEPAKKKAKGKAGTGKGRGRPKKAVKPKEEDAVADEDAEDAVKSKENGDGAEAVKEAKTDVDDVKEEEEEQV